MRTKDSGGDSEAPLRVVFFGEPSSTFSRLHYEVLRRHRGVQISIWVATPDGGRSVQERARFASLRDAAERLALRVALDAAMLRHFRVFPGSKLDRRHDVRFSRIRDEAGLAGELQELKPDLLISAGFRQILPESILRLPAIGAFNCHPSPLPRYAGSNPWFWILRGGETESAVTIHRMIQQADAGDIVAQKLFAVDSRTNHQALYNRTSLLSAQLLRDTVDCWLIGPVPERPQNLAQRTCFSAPREHDFQIDWNGTVDQIMNLVRASMPAPSAWTRIPGKALALRIRHVAPKRSMTGDAGRVLKVDAEGIVVGCGDGAIVVRRGGVSHHELGGVRLARLLGISAGDQLESSC
ncbi:MAG TPA: methionyl-tRNA formyltransferase [Bacteroidota bacterium]